MKLNIAKVNEIEGKSLDNINVSNVIHQGQPLILRGAYHDKILVKAGLESKKYAQDIIKQFYNGTPITAFMAEPKHNGRFFYNEDMTGMNFESLTMPLDALFDYINKDDTRDVNLAYYAGSTDIETYFPTMVEAQGLGLSDEIFKNFPPIMSIWMGNQTTAAIHYDMSHNIAACMVGHRRFTLFPPDQVANLYPGPLFPTPAGQVVSMVDMKNPDLYTYPNFEKALNKAQVAELEPGDVLIYPAMWWHQVDALDDFNVLVNYWWNEAPKFMDSPMNVILYSMLALRDRSVAEKESWKKLFEYYIFDDSDIPRAHIAELAQGPLAPIDIQTARKLRLMLLHKLNR